MVPSNWANLSFLEAFGQGGQRLKVKVSTQLIGAQVCSREMISLGVSEGCYEGVRRLGWQT